MSVSRGYFGIGVQESSKEGNLGNLVRSAHSFGASFFFAIAPSVNVRAVRATDTSGAFDHVPFYQFDTVAGLMLPRGCALVGVELTPDSIELPSFRHPPAAAYVLGPEMGSLSPDLQAKCDHIIKIPMKFCVNVGVAGALVMYDRLISLGRFAPRPVMPGGPLEEMPTPLFGDHRPLSATK
ncbi:MAG: TrmH family RNA methyltransferase [Alphaproteobacteria bacterium]|jgi:tRNA G18 (ribose-2'-O)-methylase SpoU|nr:TrmH family RNA methyltransferase [Alphaproteobacteria bacterium]